VPEIQIHFFSLKIHHDSRSFSLYSLLRLLHYRKRKGRKITRLPPCTTGETRSRRSQGNFPRIVCTLFFRIFIITFSKYLLPNFTINLQQQLICLSAQKLYFTIYTCGVKKVKINDFKLLRLLLISKLPNHLIIGHDITRDQ
jgi:hypothetical protein